MNLIYRLAMVAISVCVISCGGGGGNSSSGGGNNNDNNPPITRTWEGFPAFTAKKETWRSESSDSVGKYLNLLYENATPADMAAYAKMLLADGYTKISEDTDAEVDHAIGGFYIKAINGVSYHVRLTYVDYAPFRFDIGFSVIPNVEISDKWDVFPEFTAGIWLTSEEEIDDEGYEYLAQFYANLSNADIDAYVNRLLNSEGFIKMPKDSYEKVANGKRYRFSAMPGGSDARRVNFVMYNDVPNSTVKPDLIVLSPMVKGNVETTYTLNYTPTGSNATCTGIREMVLDATPPLTPGALTWTTKIISYSIGVEGGTLIEEKIIPPVYMICGDDNEEIPVIFFGAGKDFY